MEVGKNLILKLLVLFIATGLSPLFFVSAYSQNTTHPALTDEIVDFYNLHYPGEQIPEELKKEMIQGSINEDAPPRFLAHFYDPVYNRGFGVGYSSKEWAKSSDLQVAIHLNQIAGITRPPVEEHPADYSYERALKDYAIGDKKRAFRALGHVLHLLEDANVPDHTRGDAHPAIPSFESPYEQTMAKWNPRNTNIAKPLFDKGIRPVRLGSIDAYFDRVAFYSNENFFSEDTINIPRYNKPVIQRRVLENVDGETIPYGLGRDENGEFHLVRGVLFNWRNFAEEQKVTLNDLLVLNDYWSRLSNHLIPHGAGLVRLFITQAQEAERLYNEEIQKAEEREIGFFERLIGIINPFDDEEHKKQEESKTLAAEIAKSIVNQDPPLTFSETPRPAPLTTPLALLPTATPQARTPEPSPLPTQSPTSTPSPTPTPTETPEPIPALTPGADSKLVGTSSKTQIENELNSCPEPSLDETETLRNVTINEIAWMGTEAAATDEWIEFKNNTGQEIDLTCWRLIADDGTPSFKLYWKIPANGFYLIERTDDTTVQGIESDHPLFYKGALNNSGELIKLYDKNGKLQDIVGGKEEDGSYLPWYEGDNTKGIKATMERIDSTKPGTNKNNWQTNDCSTRNGADAKGNPINGTPKAANSSGGGCLGGEEEGGGGSSETPLLKLVINEIAWMGTGAHFNDEWIELYNPSSQSLDITDWTLKSFKLAGPNLIEDNPLITFATKSIDPFGYLLLERTDDEVVSDISESPCLFCIYSGALNDDGEILELRDVAGNLQDKVGEVVDEAITGWYAGEKNPPEPEDISMERKDPRKAGTDSTNWADNDGVTRNGLDKNEDPINGTPRQKNSVQVNEKPGGITDLAIDSGGTSGTKVKLTWTAPLDPDNLLAELSYDLRYATVSFGSTASEQEQVWQTAKKLTSGVPAPAASGTPQSASFNVWEYDSTVYFAIKTFDGEDNSSISNTVSHFIGISALDNAVWPMFGLNNEHTGQVSVAGPAAASVSSGWPYDFGSFAPSQPVIGPDNSIYVINTGSSGDNLSVISNSGQLEWKWPQSGTFSIGRKTIPAVLADNSFYTGVSNDLAAVASAAQDKWTICTGFPDCNGLQAGPISFDSKGDAYFSTTNQVFQAVKSNGGFKWKFSFPGTSFIVSPGQGQTPVIDETIDSVYLAGTTNSKKPRFLALDRTDGSVLWNEVWTHPNNLNTPETAPVSFDKAEKKLYSAANGAILEINPSNGEITPYLLSSLVASASDAFDRQPKSLVSIDSVNNALLVGFDYFSVATSSDKISADTKTKVFSLNKATKVVNWTYEIPLNLAGNMITVDNLGNLYFAGEDVGTGKGKLYSLSKTGSLSWEFDGGASAQGTHPVIDNTGAIYQAFGFKLYKIKQ